MKRLGEAGERRGATPVGPRVQRVNRSGRHKVARIKIQYHARHSASKVSRLDLQVRVEARNGRERREREERERRAVARVPGGI